MLLHMHLETESTLVATYTFPPYSFVFASHYNHQPRSAPRESSRRHWSAVVVMLVGQSLGDPVSPLAKVVPPADTARTRSHG